MPKGDPQMLSFGTASRLTKVPQANESSGGNPFPDRDESPSKIPGNKFGEESRSGIADTRKLYPGPGTYQVKGIFDHHKPRDYQKVIDKIERSGLDFRALAPHDLAKISGFAYGCNRNEHILYGFCLDGQCSKRIEFEKAFLQTKNHKRMGAETREEVMSLLPGCEKITKKKMNEEEQEKFKLDIFNIDAGEAMTRLQKKYDQKDRISKDKREFILSLVDEPKEYMYPLHIAASRCDVQAIRKMQVLGLDVNFVQGEHKETPLHLAVRNQHITAVREILESFHGAVDVDIQNNSGDTAIHVAARKGFKDHVEILCDAKANPLLKNDNGYTPLMEATSFPIQQLLRLQEDMYKMKSELFELKKQLIDERQKAAEIHNHNEMGISLGEFFANEGDNDEISGADMIQYPWRAQIASRGGGTAPASRASSTQSTRSRLLEITKDAYDAEVDQSKSNNSMYRVARTKTMLNNPKKNSFVLGYFADDAEK
jgi:hypothetical protein